MGLSLMLTLKPELESKFESIKYKGFTIQQGYYQLDVSIFHGGYHIGDENSVETAKIYIDDMLVFD